MSSLTMSLLAFACIFGGALVGMFLRGSLPETQLTGDTRDTVKLGTAFISTLTALVLGLLIGSAKGTLDGMNSGLTQLGAKVILVDRVLVHYGPETKPARDALRRTIAARIQTIWPDHQTGQSVPKALESAAAMETVQEDVGALSPSNDAQRALLPQIMRISGEVGELRWLLFEQRHGSLPRPLLAVLLFWLTLLFAFLGVLAPRNGMVVVVLFVCALSASGAIFLILEMSLPLEGLIKASSAPLRDALSIIGH